MRGRGLAYLSGSDLDRVKLGLLTRVTVANVAFDDYPNDKRFRDPIETVTVNPVFDWLARAQISL